MPRAKARLRWTRSSWAGISKWRGAKPARREAMTLRMIVLIAENKPGMILSIGADAVAKAPPDGYTILITSVTSSHAANLFNFKKLPYDPIKDFTPVAMLQRSYFILMVRAQAPSTTVAELTEALR